MVGATIVSTLVVVLPASSDWVTTTLVGYLWVSTIATSNTIDEGVLSQR
jgi:hypothetical protein